MLESRLKLAFISGMSGAPWGGSEMLWSSAALHLARAGHKVLASVVKWPNSSAHLNALEDAGVLIDRREFRLPSRFLRMKARLGLSVEGQLGFGASWRLISEFAPDLVCISNGAIACASEWMKRCQDEAVPYVVIAQANSEQWWPNDVEGRLLHSLYKGAIKAYFVSHANKDLFELQVGERLLNSEIVWNPFTVPYDFESTWPDDSRLWQLACVARLEPAAKGQDVLVQVLSMDKWRQRDIKVTLFGQGKWEGALRRLVDMLGVAKSIQFAGHVGDMQTVWNAHHALILPSRLEGLPLSLIEALLCGRTAIVTHVAGNCEVLKDDITGFVAAAPTIGCLDEAMERAWNRRNDWRAMGQIARSEIRLKVPRNPTEVFANKLIEIAASSERSRRIGSGIN